MVNLFSKVFLSILNTFLQILLTDRRHASVAAHRTTDENALNNPWAEWKLLLDARLKIKDVEAYDNRNDLHAVTSSKRRIRYLQQRSATAAAASAPVEDHFECLLLSGAPFVDKSLLIKELLTPSPAPILVSRPKRTGKSIGLSMVKKFLQMEVDAKGIQLPKEKRVNVKFFSGVGSGSPTRTPLRKLKIADHEDVMRRLGECPVVLVNLTDVTGNSPQEIEAALLVQLDVALSEHTYLEAYYNSVTDSSVAFGHMKSKVNELFAPRNLTAVNPISFTIELVTLCELLSKHFRRKVHLLIDEYDKPLLNAYLNFGATKPKDYDQVYFSLHSMFQYAVKANHFVETKVLTGTLPILLAYCRGGFNDVYDNAISSMHAPSPFSTYFGLTLPEVDELLTKYPTKTSPREITHLYNGYNFGDQILFNTYSVVQCVRHEGQLANYWLTEVASPDRMIDAIFASDELRANLTSFVRTPSVVQELDEYVDPKHQHSQMIYEKLVFFGYLNAIWADNTTEYYLRKYHLMIPNRELLRIYKPRRTL